MNDNLTILDGHVPGSHPPGRDRAMEWACRVGNVAAIESAERRGLSISAVAVTTADAHVPVPLVGGLSRRGVIKASTLQLAAKGGHLEAFERLVSLGARLDEPSISVASIRALVKTVMRGPNAHTLRRLFLMAGAQLVGQLAQELRDEMLLELLGAYCADRSQLAGELPKSLEEDYIGYVRRLLEAGADPDCYHLHDAKTSSSALSEAVLARSPDLVNLLLDRGARADGPPDTTKLPSRPRLALHIPMCAVAHIMATEPPQSREGSAMLRIAQALLERGADMNACTAFKKDPKMRTVTSPLLVFLSAVKTWDADVLSGLRFLLDHGARPAPPTGPMAPAGIRHPNPNYRCWYWCYPDGNLIQILLDVWNVQSLAYPAFASALEMLVSHTSFRDHVGVRDTAVLLAGYDYYRSSQAQEDGEAIVSGWLGLLAAVVRPLSPQELNEFLYHYMVRKGTCSGSGYFHSCHSRSVSSAETDELAKETLNFLVETVGANVNHRERLDDGPTALHSICVWLSRQFSSHRCRDYIIQEFCRFCFMRTPQRLEFVRFLVDGYGADAGARYEGRTLAEIVQQATRVDLDQEGIGEFSGREHYEEVTRQWKQVVAFLEEAAARGGDGRRIGD